MAVTEAERVLAALRLCEGLKMEVRPSWLSDGHQESVAEHTGQLAVTAVLPPCHLLTPVDVGRTLTMILAHGFVRAEAGDVPVLETGEARRRKPERERAATETIRRAVGGEAGQELPEHWHEFEARDSGGPLRRHLRSPRGTGAAQPRGPGTLGSGRVRPR